MENINIKVILDEVFGKSCNNIACDTCKYKEDCNLLNKFINDIKDKGLSPDQYVIVCENNSIISLADDEGIELRNYDIVIIRFNF